MLSSVCQSRRVDIDKIDTCVYGICMCECMDWGNHWLPDKMFGEEGDNFLSSDNVWQIKGIFEENNENRLIWIAEVIMLHTLSESVLVIRKWIWYQYWDYGFISFIIWYVRWEKRFHRQIANEYGKQKVGTVNDK